MIQIIEKVRLDKGRIFFLGVGGSAGNASHAVNDFRKLAGIEAYAPTDNISEITARTNDEGFETVFGTPHGLNPAAIAQAMGIAAKQITTLKELEAEISAPISGISVVVCDVPDREANADSLKKIIESLSSI